MTRRSVFSTLASAGLAAGLLLLAGCERPPVDPVQRGYRGTGMEVVYNPRAVEQLVPLNQPPAAPGPLAPDDGPKASQVYQNVKVLGDLSVANFNRHMAAITQWVAPQEGCVYCHNPANFAEDSKYTKVVARRMIQMTQKVNADWKPHVAATGVTCYTCHRGNPVPANLWFTAVPQDKRANFIGNLNGQNTPLTSVALSSLPNDPFTPYLKNALPIRVNGTTALPTGNRSSIFQAEHTFGLMVHFSKSLGVNCTYCHNTRQIGGEWAGNPQQLATAWHGIRMVRSINNDYLDGLTSTFPAQRLGPMGDVAKVNCATCHQGAFKPVYGAQMAKDFPELLKVSGTAGGAPLPPPLAEAMRSVLYFNVGSFKLEGEQAKGLTQLVASLAASPATKVTISGYHSASGDLASNQELAKNRALSVRDSLTAAGIAADRVILSKPLQTEANISGEDPVARRVEATVK
jgi:photosynthetic reaction center cytochrome c subunit